jgi:hypothetical protein
MTNINSESLEIAKTIRQQLYSTGFLKVASWGAHAFYAIENGLQFYVKGRHFKGHVRIIYDYGNDLYNILFGEFKQKEWHGVKCFEGIYFDQMVNLIDREVEYIPEYKR